MTINFRAKNTKRRRKDVKRYTRAIRVIGDGKDVTRECFYYDGRRRIGGFNKLNESGQFYLDTELNDVAVEFKKFRRLRIVKK